jgi:hypothetical protein
MSGARPEAWESEFGAKFCLPEIFFWALRGSPHLDQEDVGNTVWQLSGSVSGLTPEERELCGDSSRQAGQSHKLIRSGITVFGSPAGREAESAGKKDEPGERELSVPRGEAKRRGNVRGSVIEGWPAGLRSAQPRGRSGARGGGSRPGAAGPGRASPRGI